ncbi:MAG: hypothetical protein ABSF22_01250 [Bryobacteraceae bacterium]
MTLPGAPTRAQVTNISAAKLALDARAVGVRRRLALRALTEGAVEGTAAATPTPARSIAVLIKMAGVRTKMKNILALVFTFSLGAQAQHFTAPSRAVLVDLSFLPSVIPKWDRGFLVGHDLARATVFVADSSGKTIVNNVRIWPDNGDMVYIMDTSVSPKGGFAVPFTILSTTGQRTGAIAWLDSAGKVTKIVQLPTAAAYNTCFADDGTLWALVFVRKDDQGHEASGYDMLRHYDANGVLIGTALPRSDFASKRFPSTGVSRMAASHDRIGIYLPVTRNWIEISYSGDLLGHWILPTANNMILNVGLSDQNEVYLGYQKNNPPNGAPEIGVQHFDKTTKTLQPVDASALFAADPSASSFSLVGSDGHNLVVSKSFASPTLLWVTAQ